MSNPTLLTQLQQLLSNPLIRERKAGIAAAAEMLANDQHVAQVRALLEEIAQNDLMITVQEAAQKALDVDDARRNPRPPPPPDYVFSAVCPNGHPNAYDKREYCPNPGNVPRLVIRSGGDELDEIMLRCKTCNATFSAPVPCKGYK
jgi:hypothetical protein